MYKLYKITNQINNKIYIGITKLSVGERWEKHLKDSKNPLYPLHRAIQKYGSDTFSLEVLLESKNREEISSKEEPTIQLLESHISKNGYNVAKGGYGGDLGSIANEKRKKTMANFSKEKKEDISRKISKSLIGLRRTDDEKYKMGVLQKERGGYGPAVHTDKTRKKIAISNSGKVRTEKARQNYSKAAKLRGTGPQLQGKRVSCICCKRAWDLGNYKQHINREFKNELQ